MDTNRELRSMIFCAIHLPPLPAVVARIDRDDNTVMDNDAVESSHSIMGSMMEWSATANNEKANAARLLEQTTHFQKFKEDLLKMDLTSCSSESLYDFYGRHTRQWINTYSKVGNTLCFKPLDYVVNNDKTHQNMQGYTKAQHCLFTGQRDGIELSKSVSYADMMRKCAQWTKDNLMCSGEDDDNNDSENNIMNKLASISNESNVEDVFNNNAANATAMASSNDCVKLVGDLGGDLAGDLAGCEKEEPIDTLKLPEASSGPA